MNYQAIVIAFLFGVVATLGLIKLWRTLRGHINHLSEQVNQLVAKVEALEQAGPERLPFKSRTEIENGIAALNYLLFQARLDEDAIENAIAHFQKARNLKR